MGVLRNFIYKMDPYTKATGKDLTVEINTRKLQFMLFMKEYKETDKDIYESIMATLKKLGDSYDEDPSEKNYMALSSYMANTRNVLNDDTQKTTKGSSSRLNKIKSKLFKAIKEQSGIDMSKDVTELDLFNHTVALFKADADNAKKTNEISNKQKRNEEKIDMLKKMNAAHG